MSDIRLIAKRSFIHSVGSVERNAPFIVHSSTYARRLIARGFAELEPGQSMPPTKPEERPGRPPIHDDAGNKIKRIRGASGLGDAIYLRPLVEYFMKSEPALRVCSDYPEVFTGLGVVVERFTRHGVGIVAHYAQRKSDERTDQYQDMCLTAGVSDPVPLSFEWSVRNQALIDDVRARARGRKVVLLHGGRAPMGRSDGFGAELLPKRDAFHEVLVRMTDCFLVRIGKDESIYPLPCHLDLHASTSVTDLLDLGKSCDAMVGQCSFVIPLAEVFDKPLLVVWSAKGMASEKLFISTVTPKKVLHKASSRFIIDNWSPDQIAEVVDAFRKL